MAHRVLPMHQKRATWTADSSRNTQCDWQHFCTKNPPTWSLSPLCTFMCTVGDPSHQTQGARDKCGSPFPGSQNQTPCSCMCTARNSLAPSRLEGQVYFSKPFTNVSHEKIDTRNPWTAGKENITGWIDVCLSVLQATSTSQIWSSLLISEISYLTSKNGGWSLPPFKQSLLILPLLWKTLLLRKFCLHKIQGVVLTTFFGAKGARAPAGTSWGPKHLLSFPVCSGWHRQGPFHIWCLHIERADLRGFLVEAKLNYFILTFVSTKLIDSCLPCPKCQGSVEIFPDLPEAVCAFTAVTSALKRPSQGTGSHQAKSTSFSKRQKPKAFQSVSE